MDRLEFEEQIVRTIPKTKNTSEHENQSDTTSDVVRAIKAIRSTIRPEQYNQSDTINDMARAIQLKQYDQRYNQDEPGVGKNYIASSTYAKTRDLSKKPDV